MRYASQEDALSIDDLKHFLEIEQGIAEVTRDACLDIVNECEPSTQLRHKEMLGKRAFYRNFFVSLKIVSRNSFCLTSEDIRKI